MSGNHYMKAFNDLNARIESLPGGDLKALLEALSLQIREKLCELHGAKKTRYKEKVLDTLFSKADQYDRRNNSDTND